MCLCSRSCTQRLEHLAADHPKQPHSHTNANCDDTRGSCPGHRNGFRRRLRIAWSAADARMKVIQFKAYNRKEWGGSSRNLIVLPIRTKHACSIDRNWTSISDTLVLFGCGHHTILTLVFESSKEKEQGVPPRHSGC